MRTRRSDNFTTITVEGQILPSDLLQRIVEKDSELGGLTPDYYHLSPGETVNEATSRAWNKLTANWSNFKNARAKLPANDPGTTITRDRWLLPLFQELGYGRLPATRAAVAIDGKSYAISHWWANVPIHLVGYGVSLDRLSARVAGAARSSPHSLTQELLNRSEDSLWGFISNGLQLRILRDNQNLVRQAYVEFDLEAMMDGEAYSDFVMLWLLCHQSRVEAEKPTNYWLEKWSRAAQERGIRALEHLREGVEEAISLLGSGFLAHRSNTNLRDRLRFGTLDKQDYYRQLLRLVYRLLFLFVAEDRTDERGRSLLLDPKAPQEACDRYMNFYSTKKLRQLAGRRHGSRHSDLYAGLQIVMVKLSSDGCGELALPALGSFLFSPNAIANLNEAEISNHDLLDAVRALAFATDNQTRRQIDYKNLGSEELGSVYESLLELHPQLNVESGSFALSTAAGHERKATGSYYTPDSLVQCLLDTALDPVLNQRQHNYARLGYPSAEGAILNLKVCDPACGSGHFLIAAAHRIAKRLASVRTGDNEPSPEVIRHAVRDVVGRCLYGVDINPMAVELCKVSLWMEALEPGRPLSFLDHHILCGNSLIGTTPILIEKGVPDEAFKPIEGDDVQYCRDHKNRNRDERRGHRYLPEGERDPWRRIGNLTSGLMGIAEIADDTIEGIHQKQAIYEKLVNSSDYRYGGLLADAWCAALVWPKLPTKELPYAITEGEFRRIAENPFNIPHWMESEIKRLAARYRFFHWYLAFPDVFRLLSVNEISDARKTGWGGGFDVLLGNPPWEVLEDEEKKFFSGVRPDIAEAATAQRERMIEDLKLENPIVYRLWEDFKRERNSIKAFIRRAGLYPLSSYKKLNTYATFLELSTLIINSAGRTGLIVQSGLTTDESRQFLFRELISSSKLISAHDFENSEELFPGVHPQQKFSLVTLSGESSSRNTIFSFYNTRVEDLFDTSRQFSLTLDEMDLLSPNTGACPTFRNTRDAEIILGIYRNNQVFNVRGRSIWDMKLMQMLNSSSDNKVLDKLNTNEELLGDPETYERRRKDGWVPFYEGKFIGLFDHRLGTFAGLTADEVKRGSERLHTPKEKSNETLFVLPRWWAPLSKVEERLGTVDYDREWLFGFCDIANPQNVRTAVSTFFPKSGASDTIWLVLGSEDPMQFTALCAMVNSFALDFVARRRIGSRHLKKFIFDQLPFVPKDTLNSQCAWNQNYSVGSWIHPRVLELTYTSVDLTSFARDCGYDGGPFRWEDDRRSLIRSELDASCFHLYQVSRNDIDYIMNTFSVVRARDQDRYGEYRTKRLILEIYDEMTEAIETGSAYRTRLNPPPPTAVPRPRRRTEPLILPTTIRYPQPDAGVYMMRVILSMVQENGGAIDVERLMNACILLSVPDKMETYGAAIESTLASEWRSRFIDQFNPDLFLAKVDDLVQRGEIRLIREGAGFKVIRVSTSALPMDPHIEFDARFALLVSDSLVETEKKTFTPLATRDQIEERSRVA